MEVQPDFRELLASFNAHDVEYLIAGGYALAFHGAPRFTGDLDILVRPSTENAARVLSALDDFGFGSVGLTLEDFCVPDRVIQLGTPPVRIDLLTSISGVAEDESFATRVAGRYGEVETHFLGRAQLVANKRATGRKRDEADIEALGEE